MPPDALFTMPRCFIIFDAAFGFDAPFARHACHAPRY